MYRLLIVDDEKGTREVLASWHWERHGIHVAGSCAHGLEALEFISNRPVDIVMTDIRMPFMDGIALMESITRKYPFIKILQLCEESDATSGKGFSERSESSFSFGRISNF